MGGPHIFVSYDVTDTAYENTSMTMQLISDLRHAGAEIITDSSAVSNGAFVHFLNQMLLRCQWLILVQTPQALQSLRVQTSVNTALHLVAQQRMKGVVRVIVSSIDLQDEPFVWTTLHEFDARQDYARARDKILLALGLLRVDDELTEMQQTLLLPVTANAQASVPTLEDIPVSYRSLRGLDRPAGYSSWVSLDRPPHYGSTHKSSQPGSLAVFLKSLTTRFSAVSASIRKNVNEIFLQKPQNCALPLTEHISSLSIWQTQRLWLVLSSFALLLILLSIGVYIIVR